MLRLPVSAERGGCTGVSLLETARLCDCAGTRELEMAKPACERLLASDCAEARGGALAGASGRVCCPYAISRRSSTDIRFGVSLECSCLRLRMVTEKAKGSLLPSEAGGPEMV